MLVVGSITLVVILSIASFLNYHSCKLLLETIIGSLGGGAGLSQWLDTFGLADFGFFEKTLPGLAGLNRCVPLFANSFSGETISAISSSIW